MKFINNISLEINAVEDYCDLVDASEYEREMIVRIFNACSERADFIKSLREFGPTRKFVQFEQAQRQAMLQQQKESVMEDFKTFLHNPTREGWEKMKFKKKLKKIKLEAEAQIRQHPVSGKDQKVWRIVMIYEDEIITSADIPVEQ